jgi:hypothetical protein
MRSLCHALGAESNFEAKWDTQNKVYILKFSIDRVNYYIYRAVDLYKFFDGERNLLFVCTRSRKLAELLKDITGFAVMLLGWNNQLKIIPTRKYF